MQGDVQFDKQSDEASLQRCSQNVIDVASETAFLLKTGEPETQRPWFAPDHAKIVEKTFFVAISHQSGSVINLNNLFMCTDSQFSLDNFD